MSPIKVMVNGIPGNVSQLVANHILADSRFELIAHSLTGPEIQADVHRLDAASIQLIRPDRRDAAIKDIKKNHGPFLSVDFTHPAAVNANAEFYCKAELPFVMGTTGGDRQQLADTVKASSIAAVIAPNMAKQIVAFQAMMEYAAETFPDSFKGYTLEIRESHQKGKADTSGTAKAMVTYFNKLGVPYSENDIAQERDPAVQQHQWGIPADFLNGHAWHTYTLTSQDKTVRFEFTHNVNGRDVYAGGTKDALIYLKQKLDAGNKGKVYSMIDVLKGR